MVPSPCSLPKNDLPVIIDKHMECPGCPTIKEGSISKSTRREREPLRTKAHYYEFSIADKPALSSPTEVIHPLKVTNMQRPGTGEIRTQITPSKPKREITKITKQSKCKEKVWST